MRFRPSPSQEIGTKNSNRKRGRFRGSHHIDLDSPQSSDKAVKTASRIARDYGAVLHFLAVVPPLSSYASTFFPDGFQKEASEAALQRLHDFTAKTDLGGMTVHHVVANGAIYDQILAI